METSDQTEDFLKACLIILLVVLIVGTVGNVLALVAVTTKHCKKSSFTIYLAALAVTDTLVLHSNLLCACYYFNIFDIEYKQIDTLLCKIFTFCYNLFPQISSWLIVELTLERLLSVYFPTKFKNIYSRQAGMIIVGIITGLSVAVNCHILVGFEIVLNGNSTACFISDYHYTEFLVHIWMWMDLSLYIILPVLIMIVANTAILVKIYKVRNAVAPTWSMPTTNVSEASRIRNRQLLLITVLLSATYVLLLAPRSLFYVIKTREPHLYIQRNDAEQITEFALTVLANCNYAVNFFLYVLSGSRFRHNLRTACCPVSA